MLLLNTLPFELNITSIKLLTDGVPIDSKATGIRMEADPNLQVSVSLVGIPRHILRSSDDSAELCSTNRLEIFGYSTHLLGVKSNCRLDAMPQTRLLSKIAVDVCPSLPKLEYQLSSETTGCFEIEHIPVDQVDENLVVLEARVELQRGEDLDAQLTILNSSNVHLQYIFVKQKLLQNGKRISLSDDVIRIDEELLEKISVSALKAGDKLNVPMKIRTNGLVGELESVTVLLEFEYSGGLALEEMYCRKNSISVTIDFKEQPQG